MGVYVYENFLYGVKMTGKQVKDWMEYTQRYYKQVSNPTDPIVKDPTLNIADYNLDQLYGATYDIDLTQPACTIDPVTKRVVSGNRIKNLKVNGKLVKDSDVFTVAINNYRYNGGGGFMAAAGLSSTDPSIVTYDSAKALGDDGQVRSLMLKYIEDNKTVSPTNSNNWKISTTAVTQEIEAPVVVPDPPVVVVPKTILVPTKAIMDNIAAKVKSITGKTQNIFSFTTSADVKAGTMMKILVGKEWAGKNSNSKHL